MEMEGSLSFANCAQSYAEATVFELVDFIGLANSAGLSKISPDQRIPESRVPSILGRFIP